MNKFLCLLLSYTFFFGYANAQESPTFDQTVEYIKQNIKGRVMYPGDLDDYSRVNGYVLEDVLIGKDGRIELKTEHNAINAHDFSIIFNIFDLVEKVDYPDGIRAYKYLVRFNGLNVSSGYGVAFATDADAGKVARALRHLKKVCSKPSDLFANASEDEGKPGLSRDETIAYINNLFRRMGGSQMYLKQYYKRILNQRNWQDWEGKYKYKVYTYPPQAFRYDADKHELEFKVDISYDAWNKVNGEMVGTHDNYSMTYQIKLAQIDGYTENWDGLYTLSNGVQYNAADDDAVYEGQTQDSWSYKLLKIKFKDGSYRFIRYNTDDPKFIGRFIKALTRLKQLEQDNADPFD